MTHLTGRLTGWTSCQSPLTPIATRDLRGRCLGVCRQKGGRVRMEVVVRMKVV